MSHRMYCQIWETGSQGSEEQYREIKIGEIMIVDSGDPDGVGMLGEVIGFEYDPDFVLVATTHHSHPTQSAPEELGHADDAPEGTRYTDHRRGRDDRVYLIR